MKNRKLTAIILGAAIAVSVLSGCTQLPSDSPQQGSNTEQTYSEPAKIQQAQFEKVEEYSADKAVTITLDGSSAQINGSGCVINDSTVTITSGGTYTLSGAMGGQIIVDAKGEEVRLVLDGARITCADSAPIYIKKAKQVIITLAEGSENMLTDGVSYAYDEEPEAALFSKADLILEGSGSLTVNGSFRNGIQSKDSLEIHSGTYIVNSVDHGISGKDYLAIKDGSFTVAAGGDGLRSNNADDPTLGWISVSGGSFDIKAGQDGLQAETTLYIGGGNYRFTTGGGTGDSTKGIKAGAGMLIENGSVTVDSPDDALHSDGSLSVVGGELLLSSANDGIFAGSALSISGGNITVTESLEGIEGMSAAISGGNINVTSSDDGINSSAGDIAVSGGTITVKAGGDGIDSNGDLAVSGGTLVVNGPTNSANSPLDYIGECVISGGTIAVSGSADKAQGASASSTQANMLLCFNETLPGGTLVSLVGADDSVVYAFAPGKDFSSVFVSFPGMKVGQSYMLSLGGSCSGQPENGIYTGGNLSGASEASEVTVSQISTYYSGE